MPTLWTRQVTFIRSRMRSRRLQTLGPSLRASDAAPLFALGLVGLPLSVAAWNPLNWNGPQFLAFYFALVVAAALLALVTRLVVAPMTRDATCESRLEHR